MPYIEANGMLTWEDMCYHASPVLERCVMEFGAKHNLHNIPPHYLLMFAWQYHLSHPYKRKKQLTTLGELLRRFGDSEPGFVGFMESANCFKGEIQGVLVPPYKVAVS